ncbi:MAG: hypothetical protein U0441_19335 [Polyangiaceae bacterium]
MRTISWICGVAAAAACLSGCGNKGSGAAGNDTNNPAYVPPPSTAAAADIAGDYTITGTNPGGASKYTGTLAITKRGQVYQFSWKSGGASYDGIGVVTERTAGVAFANGPNGAGCGVVHYKVGPGGALSGRWGAWGQDYSGNETATPQGSVSGLVGKYDVSGTRLDGKAYKGTLSVAAEGAGFLFDWATGDASKGFGVRMGDFVSVGIGGDQCGFVAYEIKPDGSLSGQWSSFKSRAIGTEVATKK